MKRVHEIPQQVCRTCEAHKIAPHFLDWFVYVERNREPNESFLAAQQRLAMDAFFEFYGDDVPAISRALAVNPSTIAHMKKRRNNEARTMRLVREQAV